MGIDELGQVVVDRPEGLHGEVPRCPVEEMVRRDAHCLDVDTHRIHVGQTDFNRCHLGAKCFQLPPVDFHGEIVAELEWCSSEPVRLRLDQ